MKKNLLAMMCNIKDLQHNLRHGFINAERVKKEKQTKWNNH